MKNIIFFFKFIEEKKDRKLTCHSTDRFCSNDMSYPYYNGNETDTFPSYRSRENFGEI